MKRIVISTFGSLGDLHPFLAVGLGLRARGHSVAIATSDVYREKVEGDGLEFHAVRPAIAGFEDDPAVLNRLWNPRTGTEFLIHDVMLRYLEESFEDLRKACCGADLLVTHALWYPIPLIAEMMKIPWAGIALQPATFVSAEDPSVIGAMPWLNALRHLGPAPFRLVYGLASLRTMAWAKPIVALRRRLGLAPLIHNPFLHWAEGANQAMGWFSPLLGDVQADWPRGTVVTGFPFYGASAALSPETEAFLDAGEPPVVFTLGSAAVHFAGDFYEQSAKAARLLGRRAVLLAGEAANGPLKRLASEQVHVTAYEPYAPLFPRAAAVVHQCGIGTTGQSLQVGVPVLAVPWGHDQFDNAERLQRLGCGAVLSRKRYTGRRAAAALEKLLGSEAIAAKCKEVAEKMAEEDGLGVACDVLEGMLPAELMTATEAGRDTVAG